MSDHLMLLYLFMLSGQYRVGICQHESTLRPDFEGYCIEIINKETGYTFLIKLRDQ